MNKITTLIGVARFSKKVQRDGKTVGLVVGSFDILHLGHINLFRYAKRFINILIVGLDNDQTIRLVNGNGQRSVYEMAPGSVSVCSRLVKGNRRPINNFKRRSELLSDLETVDKIFEIKTVSHHDSEEALLSYRKLIETISPTHIFTHKLCDKHWKKKEKIAKEMRINFLLDKSKKVTNSGTIIKILSSEL